MYLTPRAIHIQLHKVDTIMETNDFNVNNESLALKKVLKPKSPVVKNVNRHLRDYCRSTTIHGFKYLGEEKTSLFEKIWWFIFLLSSFTCCILLINRIYLKWESSPVIVSFATTTTPIFELPFPAVTICPDTKVKSSIFNFTKVVHKNLDNFTLNTEEEEGFGYLSLICDKFLEYWFYGNSNQTNVQVNETVGEEFFEYIENVAPDFFNLTLYCMWLGEATNCAHFFKPIITDEGLCYTFNILDRKDFFTDATKHFRNFHNVNKSLHNWDPKTFKFNDSDLISYPYRAYLSGADAAFSIVVLSEKADIDYLCKDSLQGYRVLLHHPANIPRLSRRYFRVPLDQAVIAAVSPVLMTTSDELKSYAPVHRSCYFSHERRLRYFKFYTQDNCQMECRTNFTRIFCNCTAFYMPRGNNTKICGAASLQCLEEIENLQTVGIIAAKFNVDMWKQEFNHFYRDMATNGVPKFDCDCLPECSSVDYNVEISQSDWNWKRQFQALRVVLPDKADKFHASSLDLFFKKNHIIGLERHELYGPTDFIANFGGLLGLFTGFSIISFIEIVYFLTVRVMCNVKSYYERKRD